MSDHAPCPRCRTEGAERVGFTWWGGALGPRMLHHVRCPRCRHAYNGRTGGSNAQGIAIYVAVTTLLALALLGWLVFGRR